MTQSFAELFEESLHDKSMQIGDIIEGVIVDINNDVVIIHAGLKSEGVVPLEQFKDESGELQVAVGDTIEVALDAVEDGFGETRLSREKAVRARAWTELEKAHENQDIITGLLTGKVKGGFTVEIGLIRAFLPGSLV